MKGTNRIAVGPTNMAILRGNVDLSDWDDEELLRGRRRDRNGSFVGRPPRVVPRELYNEFVRRQLSEANQLMLKDTCEAVRQLGIILRDPKTETRDRLTAIKMITDRTMGKEPIRVELTAELKPWERVLMGGVLTDRTMPEPNDDDIVEAEVVRLGEGRAQRLDTIPTDRTHVRPVR